MKIDVLSIDLILYEVYQMPDRFVSQITRLLATAGVVNSTRGVYGGYKLAKPANKITLLEIVEAVDGPIGGGVAEFAGLAKDSIAAVDRAMTDIGTDARKRLAAVTLVDLRVAKGA